MYHVERVHSPNWTSPHQPQSHEDKIFLFDAELWKNEHGALQPTHVDKVYSARTLGMRNVNGELMARYQIHHFLTMKLRKMQDGKARENP
jgi:hypothetical protein